MAGAPIFAVLLLLLVAVSNEEEEAVVATAAAVFLEMFSSKGVRSVRCWNGHRRRRLPQRHFLGGLLVFGSPTKPG
jgi:hypothetical protein